MNIDPIRQTTWYIVVAFGNPTGDVVEGTKLNEAEGFAKAKALVDGYRDKVTSSAQFKPGHIDALGSWQGVEENSLLVVLPGTESDLGLPVVQDLLALAEEHGQEAVTVVEAGSREAYFIAPQQRHLAQRPDKRRAGQLAKPIGKWTNVGINKPNTEGWTKVSGRYFTIE